MMFARRKGAECLIALAALTMWGCVRSPHQKAARFLEAGQNQMRKKDYARAVLQFQNALRAAPRDAEPYF